MSLGRSLAALLATCATLVTPAPVAQADDAFFPGGSPPATQITRDFSLKDAAQRGLVKLTAKGRAVEGDEMSLSLTHRRVSGPVTVAIHIEFTTPRRVTPNYQEKVREVLPVFQRRAEAELNRGKYRTPRGDPVRFKLDWQFRPPTAVRRPNYHQILIVNPIQDLEEPDPNFRPQFHAVGNPNQPGSVEGTFPIATFGNPNVLAHEMLHLAGLDDRYIDVYRVGGKDYPLPERAMTPSQVAAFVRGHRPPLRPPPAGRVLSKEPRGTSPCDFMGSGARRKCRRISPRDLKFLDSRAGIQVVAEPGDVLLNKNSSKQNFGVGFRTRVLARPGETTVAEGVYVYCIDDSLGIPGSEDGFDAIGHARDLPGFEPLAKLLVLNGEIQGSLTAYVPGMANAVWNVTDAAQLETSGTAAESRALLDRAGVAENSVPGGLPYLPNPNAGSPDTAAVTQAGVEPSLPSRPSTVLPRVSITFADLYPSRVRAGRRVRSDLFVSGTGDVRSIALKLQRRAGRRWRPVRSFGSRRLPPGSEVISLNLGRLRAGHHRLVVSLGGPSGRPATRRVSLSVS